MRLSRGAGKEAMKGLSPTAAAPGQARWSACVVPAAEGPGESSRPMSTAAAVVPPRAVNADQPASITQAVGSMSSGVLSPALFLAHALSWWAVCALIVITFAILGSLAGKELA